MGRNTDDTIIIEPTEENLTPDVKITFNQNRSYELKIGREYFSFQPYETKTFGGLILEHKDFTKEIQSLFSIEILN